jgi:hypothetical protein
MKIDGAGIVAHMDARCVILSRPTKGEDVSKSLSRALPRESRAANLLAA